jgi:hypothetical protein
VRSCRAGDDDAAGVDYYLFTWTTALPKKARELACF